MGGMEFSRKLCRVTLKRLLWLERFTLSVCDTWIKKGPKAIYALKKIAEGKEVANEKELIAELESKALMKQGKLTLLALYVYGRAPIGPKIHIV